MFGNGTRIYTGFDKNSWETLDALDCYFLKNNEFVFIFFLFDEYTFS